MCTRNQAEEILHSVYHACSPIFGRIHDAYLYGSYARGDFNPESDIDILLTVDLEQAEIAKHRNDVAKVTSRLSLEHDITVSVTVKPLEQFRRYQTALPYYRNVVREGIRYAGARHHRFCDRQAAGAVQTLSDSAAVLPERRS